MTDRPGPKRPESNEEIRRALDALEPFLEALRQSTAASAEGKRGLAQQAIEAIRFVEHQLATALNAEPLRGTPNLLTVTYPIYGLQVRKTNKAAKLYQDPNTTMSYLVLIPKGQLVMLEVHRDHRGEYVVDEYDVEDEDLKAEDLPHFISTVVEAVGTHLRVSTRTMERNSQLRRFADDVLELKRSWSRRSNDGGNSGGTGEAR